jgi:Asp-tRNA(Asn)/Glu-tRNA(Gln) amidotransferase A subunit family amidase
MTGVVGLKPTAGRVSAQGVVRLASAPSIDHVGILARSVADVAAVLAVIGEPAPAGGRARGPAGPGSADAVALDARNSGASEAGAGAVGTGAAGVGEGGGVESGPTAPLAGVRIATLGAATRAALRELAVPEPDVEAAVAEACDELRRLGAELVEVELPSLALAPEAVSTFFAAELAEAHRELVAERPHDYHDGVRALIEQGLAIPPAQVAAAVRVRDTVKDELRTVLGAARADALATPTTPRAAMPLATFDPAAELGTLIPYTCPFNLTGQPAVSVPCGFTREGLPVGLQIVGRPFAEALVLRIAGAYEQATPWAARMPELP